jgi:hypothetical protein
MIDTSTIAPPGVRFLDASDKGDRAEWLERWNEWPGREVSAHPGYVGLFARAGDRVMCASSRTTGGGILYPVIVRPLASEPWAGPAEPGCDLTNAYGYGGPYAWKTDESEARAFWSQFESWALSLGAVTSFARLSPFEDQLLPFPGEMADRGLVVARSLVPSPEEIWADYDSKVRRNVQRARREGLEVEFDPKGERLDAFCAVYESTMDRRQALEQYYFPRSFFESILAGLPGQFVFAHVLSKGAVVHRTWSCSRRTRLLLPGRDAWEAYPLRPNDLLKHEVSSALPRIGQEAGSPGGGYGPDDGSSGTSGPSRRPGRGGSVSAS